MVMWAGIDEAGYGPKLGPLVVAGTAFRMPCKPREGILWELLADAVAPQARVADGRLLVNDSKLVYSPAAGLRRLEESVLCFLEALAEERGRRVADALSHTGLPRRSEERPMPWFERAHGMMLPLATNGSALLSKGEVLRRALHGAEVRPTALCTCAVFPREFNRFVSRTRNKSFLLFQKCGAILQEFWRISGDGECFVLVDRHGGRAYYRRLLLDVFPECACDVLQEDGDGSVYRVSADCRSMVIAFKEKADTLAVPTALASMTAKYVREVYMHAFNEYWGERLEGLRPTAGYWGDADRFLRDIAPALQAEGTDTRELIRIC